MLCCVHLECEKNDDDDDYKKSNNTNNKRLSEVSGDTRESEFVFQRLSVALQRFNSITFKETFSVSDEVFDE